MSDSYEGKTPHRFFNDSYIGEHFENVKNNTKRRENKKEVERLGGVIRQYCIALIALGIFLVLAAFAYYLINRPTVVIETVMPEIIVPEIIIQTDRAVGRGVDDSSILSPKVGRDLAGILEADPVGDQEDNDYVPITESVTVFKSRDYESHTITTGFRYSPTREEGLGEVEYKYCYVMDSYEGKLIRINLSRDNELLPYGPAADVIEQPLFETLKGFCL